MHTVQSKLLERWLQAGPACVLSKTCELHGNDDPVQPCSHHDHCEREAVIWLYSGDASWVYGFCNTCYNWCYPSKNEWYRVVKVSEKFKGVL